MQYAKLTKNIKNSKESCCFFIRNTFFFIKVSRFCSKWDNFGYFDTNSMFRLPVKTNYVFWRMDNFVPEIVSRFGIFCPTAWDELSQAVGRTFPRLGTKPKWPLFVVYTEATAVLRYCWRELLVILVILDFLQYHPSISPRKRLLFRLLNALVILVILKNTFFA